MFDHYFPITQLHSDLYYQNWIIGLDDSKDGSCTERSGSFLFHEIKVFWIEIHQTLKKRERQIPTGYEIQGLLPHGSAD